MSSTPSRFDQTRPAELVGASTLLRQRVVDCTGESVGRIDNLMLDAEAGTVAYAIVTVDNAKRFALPWHVLRILPGGDVMADVDHRALCRSPAMEPATDPAAEPEPVLEPQPFACGDRLRW